MMPMSRELILERAKAFVTAWNAGDLTAVTAMYSDDVAYNSSRVSSELHGASAWVQSRDEVAEHLAAMHANVPYLRLLEVLYGAAFVTLLLATRENALISVLVEPDEAGRCRRIIICHSAGPSPFLAGVA